MMRGARTESLVLLTGWDFFCAKTKGNGFHAADSLIICYFALVTSRNEFLRLLKQGGVRLDGEKLCEEDLSMVLMGNQVLKPGKKKFVRILK